MFGIYDYKTQNKYVNGVVTDKIKILFKNKIFCSKMSVKVDLPILSTYNLGKFQARTSFRGVILCMDT